LKLTHFPRGIATVQRAGQTGNGTQEGIQKVRKGKKQNVLVEGIFAHFGIRQDAQKDNQHETAKEKEQGTVNGPHDDQTLVGRSGTCTVITTVRTVQFVPIQDIVEIGGGHLVLV
jgi:hypothetical protein